MANTIQLSPSRIEDTEQWCDICEEETLHISMATELHSNPGVIGYLLECEPCTLSWEWK